MKLDNAPVTQTWIEFTFTPSPQKREWSQAAAHEFMRNYHESFKRYESIFEETVHIEEVSPSQTPRLVKRESVLDRIRARDEESIRWLQLADDRLVLNVMRGKTGSPDYRSLREDALAKLEDYVAFFRPAGLEQTELHYVDVIEIPRPSDDRLDLDAYFNLGVRLPDAFGPAQHFLLHVSLRPPAEEDNVEVRFQSEPPEPDSATYRFRVDWHAVCANVGALDRGVIGDRLNRAHDRLFEYFKASMTPKAWELFQPSEAE